MSDFDAIKASEGPNADAWAEIGAFVIAGRPKVDEEPEPDEVEEVNDAGETGDIDPDEVPEGYYACHGCGAIDLEENENAGTYGPMCDDCNELDEWNED